jgi:hypothetical protein
VKIWPPVIVHALLALGRPDLHHYGVRTSWIGTWRVLPHIPLDIPLEQGIGYVAENYSRLMWHRLMLEDMIRCALSLVLAAASALTAAPGSVQLLPGGERG